jgi:bifunctional non-homologous end joining protein LigD
VVCLDADGRPQFDDLLFGRGVPSFVAFDLVAVDGRDLRALALVERKRRLRRLLPRRSPGVLYASHVLGAGRALFAAACARDLEGVVAKPARSPYALIAGRSPWVKIKFREYSQARDRHELFAR